MSPRVARLLVLNPLERCSEIVCGLIMVLSFTGTLAVAGKEEDVRRMFVSALQCNLTWGIIDAAFYLIGCLAEYARSVTSLLSAQQSTDPAVAQRIIAGVLPSRIADALAPADFARIHAHLKQVPRPPTRVRLSSRDLRGAIGVFLIVFLSTLPVALPFWFIGDLRLALYVSDGIAIALLFSCGHMLARYSGLRTIRTGAAMVAIGAALVALMIALGD